MRQCNCSNGKEIEITGNARCRCRSARATSLREAASKRAWTRAEGVSPSAFTRSRPIPREISPATSQPAIAVEAGWADKRHNTNSESNEHPSPLKPANCRAPMLAKKLSFSPNQADASQDSHHPVSGTQGETTTKTGTGYVGISKPACSSVMVAPRIA